jgi:simple sugar transport system ATP-binding protein
MKGDNSEYLVSMENITKTFFGVRALDKVSFNLKRGEIHALLGENGAGKTTLMKILAGIYIPDEGEIYIEGKKVYITSTKDSAKYGISIVNQYPQLIDELTVSENIILAQSSLGLFRPHNNLNHQIIEIAKKYGFKLDPNARVMDLSFSERQRVEIIKSILQESKIIIMDEPTTLLTTYEKKLLYKFMKLSVDEGKGIVLITHKLDEALEIADRITVLKKGKNIGCISNEEASYEKLLEMMFGTTMISTTPEIKLVTSPHNREEIILSIENLVVSDDYGREAVKNVTFKIYRGEIYGIAGIAGNGQRELVEAIYGLRPYKSGVIRFFDRELTTYRKDMIKRLIAYVPDKIDDALILDYPVYENIILKTYNEKYLKYGFIIDYKNTIEDSSKLIEEFNIVVDSPYSPTGTLSGGNLQKLILARESAISPRLLILVNPSRALDHMSSEKLYQKLSEFKNKGTAILLVSEDRDEILKVSDRVSVMYDGRIYELGNREDVEMGMIESYMVSGK